jgi:hypothetical protein
VLGGNHTRGLKHFVFFDAVGKAEEDSLRAYEATAGLLLVRLIDHWILAGMVMVEPESVSVRSVRGAIAELPLDNPHRAVLFGIINSMQTSREVDVAALFPYMKKYEELLDQAEWSKPLSYDLCLTIQRIRAQCIDNDEEMDLLRKLLRTIDPPRAPRRKKPKKPPQL